MSASTGSPALVFRRYFLSQISRDADCIGTFGASAGLFTRWSVVLLMNLSVSLWFGPHRSSAGQTMLRAPDIVVQQSRSTRCCCDAHRARPARRAENRRATALARPKAREANLSQYPPNIATCRVPERGGARRYGVLAAALLSRQIRGRELHSRQQIRWRQGVAPTTIYRVCSARGVPHTVVERQGRHPFFSHAYKL